MNKIIKNQLSKVRVQLPEYDDNTTEMIIPRQTMMSLPIMEHNDFIIGKFYILQLAKYITNPLPNFDLAEKWNNGVVPSSEYIRCQVTDIKGKMINVGAIGFDVLSYTDKTDVYSSLWLPKAAITIVKEL